MHLGNIRIALYNYIFSKANKGKFILRIEDTDRSRFSEASLYNIHEILESTGLVPDEGPKYGGEYGPYIQSKRLNIYKEYTNKLIAMGNAYRCFCTDERLHLIKKNNDFPDISKYDGRCQNLDQVIIDDNIKKGLNYCVRFKLNPRITYFNDLIYGRISRDVSDIEGDFIILKTDKYPTYHLANVVDDHLMHISHVIRGSEWISSTTKHIMLYSAFEWKPPLFAHLPLIYTSDGVKLSKRNQDLQVKHLLVNKNYFPETLFNFVILGSGGFRKFAQDNTKDHLLNLNTVTTTRKNFLSFDTKNNPGKNALNNENNNINVNEINNNNIPKLSGDYYEMDDLIEQFKGLKHVETLPIKMNLNLMRDINKRILGRKIEKLIMSSSDVDSDSNKLCNQDNILVQQLRTLLASRYGKTISDKFDSHYLSKVLTWGKHRISTLRDFIEPELDSFEYLWLPPSLDDDIVEEISPVFVETLERLVQEMEKSISHPSYDFKDINSRIKSILNFLIADIKANNATIPIKDVALTFSSCMQNFRWIITGNKKGPSIPELFEILGIREISSRFQNFKTKSESFHDCKIKSTLL
ncbi:unnamed protein product [Gordionus sp. m RMFG-2023]